MAQDTQLGWDVDGRRAAGQSRAGIASTEAAEAERVGPLSRPMASNTGRENSPSARTRARTPRRDSETVRSSTPRVSPRRSLVTSGNLRRTRVSTGIRAALDRATRNSAETTPQDAGQSPRSGDQTRTTKFVQEDGFRAGRWRDLGGRFTTPPSPGDGGVVKRPPRSRHLPARCPSS